MVRNGSWNGFQTEPRLPEIPQEPTFVLKLVVAELHARAEQGIVPNICEYASRFPVLTDKLRKASQFGMPRQKMTDRH